MRKRLTPDEQTWQNMRDSLRTLKSRCASLERQNKRLLSDNPLAASEAEVMRLGTRCEELTRLIELAELEVLQLRRQIARVA